MPEDPPLPPPHRPDTPYVQWGTCGHCDNRFPMTAAMVRRCEPKPRNGTTEGKNRGEKPCCSKCRYVVKKQRDKRREKKVKSPDCAVKGKVRAKWGDGLPKSKLSRMHLRRAPGDGVPRWCNFQKKYFLTYFIGRSRNATDEERAYLDAKTPEAAIAEARDWYTRALLNGARWLPEDFTADITVNEDQEATRKLLRSLRNKDRRFLAPRRIIIRPQRVRVWVDRYTVLFNGKVCQKGFVSYEQAMKYAEPLRIRHAVRREPVLKKCVKCGERAVWDGSHLVHEGGDYCANMVMVRDRRFTRLTKIALWNRILRHGDYGGWWDFRWEHVLLMDKIKQVVPDPKEKDPLDGFEI